MIGSPRKALTQVIERRMHGEERAMPRIRGGRSFGVRLALAACSTGLVVMLCAAAHASCDPWDGTPSVVSRCDVTTLLSYPRGYRVCFQGNVLRCAANGSWQSIGSCAGQSDTPTPSEDLGAVCGGESGASGTRVGGGGTDDDTVSGEGDGSDNGGDDGDGGGTDVPAPPNLPGAQFLQQQMQQRINLLQQQREKLLEQKREQQEQQQMMLQKLRQNQAPTYGQRQQPTYRCVPNVMNCYDCAHPCQR